ncbi:MAG: hypothetical protein H6739_14580 [Alphaproteobacteria bacterium]|nr:hypothetical protein [Alphaproteobacteria bacterium]
MTLRHLLLPLALLACDKDDTDDSAPVETAEPEASVCEGLGLSEVPFDADGPFGTARRDLAADFTVPLLNGETFTLSEAWTGCDATVFIPHYLPVSTRDNASVWTTGVADLVERSPVNARYLFVVMGASGVDSYGAALQQEIDEYLVTLSEADAAWWGQRLLVVAEPSETTDAWIGGLLESSVGGYGFGIDRAQRIRGLGSLTAVEAFDYDLYNAGEWPWERRLYSAAFEAEYMNFEAAREARLDAVDATLVEVFDGGVIEQYEDTTVTLPDAATLAGFDTLEVDVVMECPDTGAQEAGNCGAWDYLAHLWLWDEATESWLEMARFITTYHRESRWVVDASHALAWLQGGGERQLRYEWAPSWNTQPTGVTLTLRLSNQGKGSAPQEIVPLFTGGNFNSAYNDGREPIDVDIPADAVKVEFVALTTGHGGATQNCAEFCPHQHEFTLGGTVYMQEFPEASTDTGCAEKVSDGVVPNQWGTWWFGRGGWCPGQRVDPFVVDATALATPGGTLTVSYRGLLGGSTPPDDAGSIELRSWLVISK